MIRYLYAGDTVETELDLPLTPSFSAVVDVRISIHRVDSVPTFEFTSLLHRGDMDDSPWALGVLADGSGWGAVLGVGCAARISQDAKQIEMSALHEAPDEWLADALVGWALVYRLAVVGRPAFHASAVTLDASSAIVLCGASHSGKSTMAGAALALGGSLVSDDVLVPTVVGDQVVVHNTASRVKLRDLAKAFGDGETTDARPTFDDRLSVADTAPTSGLPLARIVFLDPDGPPGVRPLEPDDVVFRLLANSKVGTWSWPDGRNHEFDLACDVAARVPGFAAGRDAGAVTRDMLLRACAGYFEL